MKLLLSVFISIISCLAFCHVPPLSQKPSSADSQATHFRWSERLAYELDYKHTIATAKELSPKEREELLAFVVGRFKHSGSDNDESMFEGISDGDMRRLAADTRIEFVDLNGDGVNEIIAQGNGLGPCGGTGNCIVLVLERTREGWSTLLDTFREGKLSGGFEKIRVMDTSRNGFRDIVLAGHISASERNLVVYRHSDGRYRAAECYDLDWWCWECNPPHTLKNPQITRSNHCR